MSQEITREQAFDAALSIARSKNMSWKVQNVSKPASGWSGVHFVLRGFDGEVLQRVGRREIEIEIFGASKISSPFGRQTIWDEYFFAWKKSFNFSGKANRKQFWRFVLIDSILLFLLGVLVFSAGECTDYSWSYSNANRYCSSRDINYAFISLTYLYLLASSFTRISLLVRRIRDTGRHWAFIFLYLVPFFGPIILFVWTIEPSKDIKHSVRQNIKVDSDNNEQSSRKSIQAISQDPQRNELDRINNMFNDGVITEQEYHAMRKKVLGI